MALSKKAKVHLARAIERLQTSEYMRARSEERQIAAKKNGDTVYAEKLSKSSLYWWYDTDRAIIELSEEFGIEMHNLQDAKRRMEEFWPHYLPR